MAITLSTGTKNILLESGIDAAFNNGVLELRSGAKPATADTAAAGTLLATLTCPADIFAAAAAGAKALNAALTGTGLPAASTGSVIGHFRLRESSDTGGASAAFKRIDGDVGQLGASISVTSATYNAGAGTVDCTTGSAHGRAVGDYVLIAGSTLAVINGLRKITAVGSATTFLIANPAGNTSSGTGGTIQYAPADLNFDNTSVAQNQTVNVSALTIALP